MKLSRLCSVGIAALLMMLCSVGISWSVDSVRQVVAVRVATPPILDGKMGDPAWAFAHETGDFTVLRHPVKSPATPTYVKVLTDGKSLYIGFRCVEPKLSETKSPVVPRDGSVWAQDNVEVVIDPSGDHKECYDLVGGLSGSQCDAKLSILFTGAVNQDLNWNGDWELKTWRGENEWRAEMCIPYSAVGIDTAKNAAIGINFNRARWVGESQLSNWSPNDANFSEPWSLGELIIPDVDGSYCNVRFPRLQSIVAGKSDISVPILNSSSSSIQPKIDLTITGTKNDFATTVVEPKTVQVPLDRILPHIELDAKLPINIDEPGKYHLSMNVTDSATGKPLYKLSRDIEATQAFVFDEALYALYHKRVDATVDIRVPSDNGKVIFSLVKDGAKKPIKTRTIKSGSTWPMKVSFSLKGQNDGVYRLRAELMRDGQTVATAVSRAYSYKRDPKIPTNKDGYLVVDGKPFFPIGIYSVMGADRPESTKIAKEVKDAGFNCTVIYHQSVSLLMPVLDSLQEAGLKAFVYATEAFVGRKEPLTIERVHQDIDARRNHPALLGWYVVDEPEGIGYAPVKAVRDLYQAIKEYDQDHPCTLVIMSPTAAKDYDACCDMVWTDPYPVPDQPVTDVSETVGGAVKNIEKDKPVWCIPQAFDWHVWNEGKIGPVHRPTDDEERCMTYLALVNGAKGIIYWAYTSSRYNSSDYPEHWAYMKKLAGEVSSISPVLMTPTVGGKLSASAKGGALETMVKRVNGDWYVFAVNSATTPCTGSFKLAGVEGGKLEALFENRTLAGKDGAWTDAFKPLEVHVYKLSSH